MIKPETIFAVPDIPITHAILASALTEYSRVNDKIAFMVEKGEIIKVQRGLYIFNKPMFKNQYLNYNIANTLYGPSYVSRYSALGHYGLLAEYSNITESMTLSRYREYDTSVGNFAYFHSSKKTFSIGINSFKIDEHISFLMASPEKALCDLIWTEKNLPIKSSDDMVYYLEEDLRFDMSFFNKANLSVIKECMKNGNKKKEIGYLLKLI
jgi:hypothetical protein